MQRTVSKEDRAEYEEPSASGKSKAHIHDAFKAAMKRAKSDQEVHLEPPPKDEAQPSQDVGGGCVGVPSWL
eukprot:CAMPEP_0206246166 /NCGR_PEP_ID=MMETSP0047_2-20121206/19102_1 /ASSEMBLY_ACC=CAM_ASM_000192 /TAXON_ID=195065 /ORGANISM="Chroomonas mesostigmatica_cf, Strain CCMP1168" /LENGTH=70 /DNA_ID=CAMNT_0053671547 /DNA_START=33 /DNA_END=243 /DNA_ORIENTATION=-